MLMIVSRNYYEISTPLIRVSATKETDKGPYEAICGVAPGSKCAKVFSPNGKFLYQIGKDKFLFHMYVNIDIKYLDKQQMNNSSKYLQEYGTNNKIGIFSSLQCPVSDL